jgi:hypothetical protein
MQASAFFWWLSAQVAAIKDHGSTTVDYIAVTSPARLFS